MTLEETKLSGTADGNILAALLKSMADQLSAGTKRAYDFDLEISPTPLVED